MDISLIPSDKDKVLAFEQMLLQEQQVHFPAEHLIHGGMYARTVLIPAGIAATGAELNVDTISILFGDITVSTDDGVQRLTGWHVLPASSGTKRVGVVHADTYWTTVMVNPASTVPEAEALMTDDHQRLLTNRVLPDNTLYLQEAQ